MIAKYLTILKEKFLDQHIISLRHQQAAGHHDNKLLVSCMQALKAYTISRLKKQWNKNRAMVFHSSYSALRCLQMLSFYSKYKADKKY